MIDLLVLRHLFADLVIGLFSRCCRYYTVTRDPWMRGREFGVAEVGEGPAKRQENPKINMRKRWSAAIEYSSLQIGRCRRDGARSNDLAVFICASCSSFITGWQSCSPGELADKRHDKAHCTNLEQHEFGTFAFSA
jgi:hypothetical protein